MAKKPNTKNPVLTPAAKKTAMDNVLRARALERFNRELEAIKSLLRNSPITRSMTAIIKFPGCKDQEVYWYEGIEAAPKFEEMKEEVLTAYEKDELDELIKKIDSWKQHKL